MLNLRDGCFCGQVRGRETAFYNRRYRPSSTSRADPSLSLSNTPGASPPTPPTEPDTEEPVPRHDRNRADRKCTSADRCGKSACMRFSGATLSVNVGDTAKIRGRPTRRAAALTLNSGNSERYAFE